MDIYEFTQALRRQWKLLLIGFLGLSLAVFAAVFNVTRIDGRFSLQYRIPPKYESSVEMVVVSAGLESLASPAVAGGFAGPAQVYAQLLETPEAARQIEETQGIDLLGTLNASSPSDSSFITATATSSTAESAAAGAMGAFRWLEGRLAEPPVIAQVPEPETAEPAEEEFFLGDLLLDVDRLYATADPALTLVVGNFQDDEVAFSLQEAAGQLRAQVAYLKPESSLIVSVERDVGVALDTVTLDVPPLPETDEEPPALVLSIDRGGIQFDEVDAQLEEDEAQLEVVGAQFDESRFSVRWDTGTTQARAQRISLMLITQELTVTPTGQRRAPILAVAILGAGTLALLVLATTVETWKRAYEERRRPAWRQPVSVEGGTVHRLEEPGAHAREDGASARDQGPRELGEREIAPRR